MTTTVNYTNANAELKDNNWLKLEQGIHSVTFLEDLPFPEKKESQFKDKDGKNKMIEQSNVLVEYQRKQIRWTIIKAEGKKSLWGQLIALGKHYNSLVGKTIEVSVKVNGTKREYMIREYLLLAQQNKL